MTRLSILAVLTLSACTTALADKCYRIDRNPELRQQCKPQNGKQLPTFCCDDNVGSGSVYVPSSTPPVDPPSEPEGPSDDRNYDEPPGHKGVDRNEADYDRWKESGYW